MLSAQPSAWGHWGSTWCCCLGKWNPTVVIHKHFTAFSQLSTRQCQESHSDPSPSFSTTTGEQDPGYTRACPEGLAAKPTGLAKIGAGVRCRLRPSPRSLNTHSHGCHCNTPHHHVFRAPYVPTLTLSSLNLTTQPWKHHCFLAPMGAACNGVPQCPSLCQAHSQEASSVSFCLQTQSGHL